MSEYPCMIMAMNKFRKIKITRMTKEYMKSTAEVVEPQPIVS